MITIVLHLEKLVKNMQLFVKRRIQKTEQLKVGKEVEKRDVLF